MGCNFYYKNGEHVGKRSAWGLYCWGCNTPHDTLKLLLDSGGEGMVIEDEYGKEYTAKEFMEILEGCPVWSCDHIGEDFS